MTHVRAAANGVTSSAAGAPHARNCRATISLFCNRPRFMRFRRIVSKAALQEKTAQQRCEARFIGFRHSTAKFHEQHASER